MNYIGNIKHLWYECMVCVHVALSKCLATVDTKHKAYWYLYFLYQDSN